MRPITLTGFADKFAQNSDPWNTWGARDEVLKRQAILHALPVGLNGRILELGAGNGSNSQALVKRSLRLDATEATQEGTQLVAKAVAAFPRARAIRLIAPDRPPRHRYDTVVIAELLYYLSRRDMAKLARQVVGLLAPGGAVVLAHHRITYYDFAQHADGIQKRFLDLTGATWMCRPVRRTGRWSVLSCTRSRR